MFWNLNVSYFKMWVENAAALYSECFKFGGFRLVSNLIAIGVIGCFAEWFERQMTIDDSWSLIKQKCFCVKSAIKQCRLNINKPQA